MATTPSATTEEEVEETPSFAFGRKAAELDHDHAIGHTPTARPSVIRDAEHGPVREKLDLVEIDIGRDDVRIQRAEEKLVDDTVLAPLSIHQQVVEVLQVERDDAEFDIAFPALQS